MIRTFVAALLLTVSAQAADYSQSTCKEVLDSASKELAAVNDRFEVGEVTRLDLNQAKIVLLNSQFDCRAIYFKAYCDETPALATELVKFIQEEVQVGRREINEIYAAKRELAVITNRCQ